MRRLAYFARQAVRSMAVRPLMLGSAVVAVAMTVTLLGLAALAALNVDRLTQHWGRGGHVVVYLERHLPPVRVAALARLLETRPEVTELRKISSSAAHQRLRASLGRRGALLDDLERDFLPPSFELTLSERADRSTLSSLLSLLRTAEGVDEIDHFGDWTARLGAVAGLLRRGAAWIALIVGIACLLIVAVTIRLAVFARRDEIEIQLLVGATRRFVRAPFLIEGAITGLVGSVVAAGVLYALYRGAASTIESDLSAVYGAVGVAFLTPAQLGLGVIASAAIGLMGSALALSRHLDSWSVARPPLFVRSPPPTSPAAVSDPRSAIAPVGPALGGR